MCSLSVRVLVTLGACGRLVKDLSEDIDLVVEYPTRETALIREPGDRYSMAIVLYTPGPTRIQW